MFAALQVGGGDLFYICRDTFLIEITFHALIEKIDKMRSKCLVIHLFLRIRVRMRIGQ